MIGSTGLEVIVKDEQEEFLPSAGQKTARRFNSVDVFNKEHNEDVFYRQLEFPVTVAGKDYRIMVRKSQEETDDIIEAILKITFIVVLILLLALFLINRFVLNKLWKPFHSTLQQMQRCKQRHGSFGGS